MTDDLDTPIGDPIAANGPEPRAKESKPPRQPWTRLAVSFFMVGALLLAACGGAFAVLGEAQLADATTAHSVAVKQKKVHDAKVAKEKAAEKAREEAEEAAEEAAAQAAEQKQQADDAAESAGFTPSPTADGLVFYKGEKGTCSTFLPCIWMAIAVAQSCPSGVYVSANVEDANGIVLGYGNKITGALDPDHGTVVEIIFTGATDSAAKIEVTDAHCM